MTSVRPRWALTRPRHAPAALRMYCFPHSGGSPGEYMRWASCLPDTEIWGIQAPGRGSRISEAPHTDMAELVDALLTHVDFGEPCVFFGHSLGALVAYEAAQALRERGRPGPQALVLSATAAPHALRRNASLHGLDGAELVEAIERTHGPVSADIHEDPELREMLLVALRGDLDIVSGYRHRPRPPLTCPITVFGGSDDDERTSDLRAWRDYTTGPFDFRLFPGDHFYFRERPDEFFAALRRALPKPTARAVPGVRPMAAAPVLP
ncbi:thioesterase II family protein [Streptomyces montanisoli]|uniref:Thioesterase n=1 Tax=Streptomyces montanisoli TaxID=2798581 RepID=A0A940M9L4_9ACTN|nr:alpha/beta fold hydrolase [Streptomyces montanisoli]MBP0456872.1 thioesterase [Streptomyces montanisoli]